MGDLNLKKLEFDEAFIQAPEHRPNLAATEADGVPIIDLSPIFDSAAGDFPEDVVRQIAYASREWGFFVVVNHGVPLEKRRRIEAAARKFFWQSLEEKRKVRRDEGVRVVMGYFDAELTKNVRDWKEVFDFTAVDPTVIPASPELEDDELTQWTNQWPEYPPEFREVCEEYVVEVEKLGHKLLELIAVSLGLSAERFRGYFKEQTSYLRMNHYPTCPSPELALGVGRHKDPGVLTMLAQDDVGGLEVKRKRDGEWVRVKPVPNSYVINVGDIIQVWSNERYKSVEHRAMVNSTKERFSISFFLTPSHDTIVEPLKELTDLPQNPPKYKPYSWGKFFSNRKRSNFKKLDVENIQISDFKIDK